MWCKWKVPAGNGTLVQQFAPSRFTDSWLVYTFLSLSILYHFITFLSLPRTWYKRKVPAENRTSVLHFAPSIFTDSWPIYAFLFSVTLYATNTWIYFSFCYYPKFQGLVSFRLLFFCFLPVSLIFFLCMFQ